MCYNIQQKQKKIRKYLSDIKMIEDTNTENLTFDYHTVSGFVHPELLVVASNEPKKIQFFKWGLVPSWCRDEDKAKEIATMTLNARSETVFEKPSFKSISNKRCILPVDGFFEWHTIGKNKYPYFIYLKSKNPLLMGCLYDTWVNKETGEVINGLSIVTTEANELLEKIHNTKKRMPLILPEENTATWLDLKTPKEDLQNLMIPFDFKLMGAHTISKRITDRNQDPNVPEVTEPFNFPELCQPTNIDLNF